MTYKIPRFEIVGWTQEKSKSRDLLFSIQSEGLACNLTAGEYVIAEGVWHHASACISPSDWLHSILRVDSIPQTSCGFHPRLSAWFYELHFCTMSTKIEKTESNIKNIGGIALCNRVAMLELLLQLMRCFARIERFFAWQWFSFIV